MRIDRAEVLKVLGSLKTARVVLLVTSLVAFGVLVAGMASAQTTPSISIDDVSVVEGAGQVQLTLRLSGPSNSDIGVELSTIEGSAKAGTDYEPFGTFTPPRKFVVIPAGETIAQPIAVIKDDAISESAESFTIRLSEAVNATIADADGVVTIINDDGTTVAPPQISISDATGTEPSGQLKVPLTLSFAPAQPVRVRLSQLDGTAKEGFDYAPPPTDPIEFGPGESLKLVSIQLFNDNVAEGSETFTLRLIAPSGGTIADGEGTMTIVDDEAPSSPTPTTTPTPSPTASSPSPSPSVTETPPPLLQYVRLVSLRLSGHLQATGRVEGGSAPVNCIEGVGVTIKRRTARGWNVIATTTTATGGAYSVSLADRGGRYKAKIAPFAFESPPTECFGAVSPIRRHRH
jgi:hypothetical protein